MKPIIVIIMALALGGCAGLPDAPLTYHPASLPGYDCLWFESAGSRLPHLACARGHPLSNVCLFVRCDQWAQADYR